MATQESEIAELKMTKVPQRINVMATSIHPLKMNMWITCWRLRRESTKPTKAKTSITTATIISTSLMLLNTFLTFTEFSLVFCVKVSAPELKRALSSLISCIALWGKVNCGTLTDFARDK
uniref:Uncharacterized protein n=1 Tax=Opuntia streptacantha TaxID=393608 RepID=A0A7C9AB83_OPUST